MANTECIKMTRLIFLYALFQQLLMSPMCMAYYHAGVNVAIDFYCVFCILWLDNVA